MGKKSIKRIGREMYCVLHEPSRNCRYRLKGMYRLPSLSVAGIQADAVKKLTDLSQELDAEQTAGTIVLNPIQIYSLSFVFSSLLFIASRFLESL